MVVGSWLLLAGGGRSRYPGARAAGQEEEGIYFCQTV